MALDTQVIEFAKSSGWRRKCGDLLRRFADAIDTGGVSLRAHRTRKVSGSARVDVFDPRIDARVMDVPFDLKSDRAAAVAETPAGRVDR